MTLPWAVSNSSFRQSLTSSWKPSLTSPSLECLGQGVPFARLSLPIKREVPEDKVTVVFMQIPSAQDAVGHDKDLVKEANVRMSEDSHKADVI